MKGLCWAAFFLKKPEVGDPDEGDECLFDLEQWETNPSIARGIISSGFAEVFSSSSRSHATQQEVLSTRPNIYKNWEWEGAR